MSIKDCLMEDLDCILSIREDIGAVVEPCSIVTRMWSGHRVGDGVFNDVVRDLSPQPAIKDLSHSVMIGQGGSYQSGDIILKGISKKSFSEADLLTDTGSMQIEKMIKVGRFFYRTIHIKSSLLTYDIHLRKVSMDETE